MIRPFKMCKRKWWSTKLTTIQPSTCISVSERGLTLVDSFPLRIIGRCSLPSRLGGQMSFQTSCVCAAKSNITHNKEPNGRVQWPWPVHTRGEPSGTTMTLLNNVLCFSPTRRSKHINCVWLCCCVCMLCKMVVCFFVVCFVFVPDIRIDVVCIRLCSRPSGMTKTCVNTRR